MATGHDPCIGNDPACPCQDGLACHYVDLPGSPAWPIPQCDDREVMRLWRECGLPEYFLGNGGSKHKLVEFARRIRDVSA